MATGTISGPVIIVGMPDERATPSNISKTSPVAGPTDATEGNLEVEVSADSGNLSDPNGIQFARPRVSGTPSSSSTSFTLDVLQPGRPDAKATYTYTESSVTYGQIPPWIVSGFETIYPIASLDGMQRPRGCADPAGVVYVVYEDWDGGDGIGVRKRSDSTHVWSDAIVNVWSGGLAFTSNVHPSPDIITIQRDTASTVEQVVASLWIDTAASDTTHVLRLDRTVDAWASQTTTYSDLSLTVSSIYYDMLRIAYDPVSQQMMLGLRQNNGGTYTGLYYVSNDDGATWTALTALNQSSLFAHDIKSFNGVFYVVSLIDAGGGTGNVRLAKRGASDGGWTYGPTTFQSGTADATATANSLALTIGPNGTLWANFRRDAPSSADIITCHYSTDGGSTWSNSNMWEDGTGGATHGVLINGSVYTTGRMFLLGTYGSTTTTTDNSLVALLSGGISSHTPATTPGGYDGVIPTEIPNNRSSQHVFTTSGATTETAGTIDANNNLCIRLSTDNSTGYYTTTYTGATQMNGHGASLILGNNSTGGSVSSDAIAIRIGANATAGGGNDVEGGLRINMTSRSVQARDYNAGGGAGADVGTAKTWTAGEPVEFWIAVDYLAATMTAKVRVCSAESWTAIVTDQALTVTAAGATLTQTWGKISASTAQVDIIMYSPFTYGNGGRTSGDTSPALLGIRAASHPTPPPVFPERLPNGLLVSWDGSPLQPGDSWTVTARSTTPLTFTSPFSAAQSPTRQWVSATETAGFPKYFVYDFGSSYRGKLSRNLIYVSWANAGPFESVRLYYWDGAAYQTAVLGSTKVTAFTGGSTGFTRDNVASYTFRPNAANANTQYWGPDAMKGNWAVINDGGGDVIAGTVLRNDPGYFSTTAGALQAAIELDPSTVVVVSGTFAGVGTTTTGTLDIYGTDGMAVGTQAAEAVEYYAVECDLAPGATVMRAGLLTFGAAHVFARPYRDGASMRWLAPDELRSLPGSKLLQGRRVGRKQQRAVEIPWDQLTIPNGMYNLQGATPANGLSFDGSTVRTVIDSNLVDLVSLHARAGQRYPVCMVVDADWQADPGSSTQSFTQDNVIHGFLASSIDITAGMHYLRSPGNTDGSQLGSSLLLVEIV